MKKFIFLLILGLFLFSFSAYAEMSAARSVTDIAGAEPATEAVCGPITIKPMSLTATDIYGYPWPWFYSGDTCSGIAYFETKGEGYVQIKAKIVDKWGYVTDVFDLGTYYVTPNSGSCTIPSTWYANLSTTCGYPGVYNVVVNLKRLYDGKTWQAQTKLRIW